MNALLSVFFYCFYKCYAKMCVQINSSYDAKVKRRLENIQILLPQKAAR